MASPSQSLSLEARLLLLTASVPFDDLSLRGALDTGIDWQKLCVLARHERAAPIVLRALRRLGPEPSDPGFDELRKLAMLSVIELMHLERLLHRALDTLAARGIEAMLLKGAGLAYTAYGSFADRPMGDLDVLVRPEQVQDAWEALQAHGWCCPTERVSVAAYTGHHHMPPLLDASLPYRLEIHRHLVPQESPFRLAMSDVWARARQARVAARSFTVPHPLHQLWHLCVHFAWSHTMSWGSWRTLRDAAALVLTGEIEWREFVGLAQESRAATCCYWTLRLARRLAGARIPDHVLSAVRPRRPQFVLDSLERHYVSNLFPSDHGSPSVWLTHRLWEAGIAPRWSGHRSARPWHVSERWLVEQPASASRSAEPRVTRAPWTRRVGAVLGYLSRMRRSANGDEQHRSVESGAPDLSSR